ncbi:nitroreductase family protein [Ktedonobacteria bacterium brp13]|nr:nitroreductase family protein [Ktedonobacteria bacterium brp13]
MGNTNVTTLHKPASAQYPIHDLISHRWSPRAFSDQPVDQATLKSLFEAARWAASAANKQPWNFIYATRENPEAFERLAAILVEANSVWAKNASVLILTVAKRGEYAGHEYTTYYELGMAVGNLVTQAVELGLATHQMGGFDKAKAIADLNIPEGYDPITVLAVGYPGNHETLPETLREREIAERTRKAQDEFVFEGSWK